VFEEIGTTTCFVVDELLSYVVDWTLGRGDIFFALGPRVFGSAARAVAFSRRSRYNAVNEVQEYVCVGKKCSMPGKTKVRSGPAWMRS